MLMIILISVLSLPPRQYVCLVHPAHDGYPENWITIPAGRRLPGDAGNGNKFYHFQRRAIFTKTEQGWRRGFYSWRTPKNAPTDRLVVEYYLIPKREYVIRRGRCR